MKKYEITRQCNAWGEHYSIEVNRELIDETFETYEQAKEYAEENFNS